MPKIERIVWLMYRSVNFPFNNCKSSDDQAIIDAIHGLEAKLGKMRGSLTKHFKDSPDDIVVVLK